MFFTRFVAQQSVIKGQSPAARPTHPLRCLFLLWLSQTAEDMASTGDLEPTHYPARRAAQVALHYLNTNHGSPFRVFGLQQVHKASAEVRHSFSSLSQTLKRPHLQQDQTREVCIWITVFANASEPLCWQDVAAGGRKYKLDFSVTDWGSGSAVRFFCSYPLLTCSETTDSLLPNQLISYHCRALVHWA